MEWSEMHRSAGCPFRSSRGTNLPSTGLAAAANVPRWPLALFLALDWRLLTARARVISADVPSVLSRALMLNPGGHGSPSARSAMGPRQRDDMIENACFHFSFDRKNDRTLIYLSTGSRGSRVEIWHHQLCLRQKGNKPKKKL
jgi:hypothetical protein